MTLIINSETGKKLSKRDESVLQFIEQYRDLGYLPEAMFNFITLLGWSPKGENEIFTKREFIKQFDPARLSKSPAAFDQKKLEWINNQYIKKADRDTLLDLALNNLQEAGLIDEHPTPEKMEWYVNWLTFTQYKCHTLSKSLTWLRSSLKMLRIFQTKKLKKLRTMMVAA